MLKNTADNMGFARCGVEGNLRKFSENTRKKLFPFFKITKKLKNGKVFARDWFSSPLSVAVSRTSQSPFPLCAILANTLQTKNENNK